MPNHKSLEDWEAAKAERQANQAKAEFIPKLEAEVKRVGEVHAQLCEQHGDSGSVRQRFESLSQQLEDLKNG